MGIQRLLVSKLENTSNYSAHIAGGSPVCPTSARRRITLGLVAARRFRRHRGPATADTAADRGTTGGGDTAADRGTTGGGDTAADRGTTGGGDTAADRGTTGGGETAADRGTGSR